VLKRIAIMNCERLNYDKQVDFTPLMKLGRIEKYDSTTQDEILKRVHGQEIIITKELSLSKEVILDFPETVRMICEAGTGYNNIHIEAAKRKNIKVCNVPDYSSEAVAHLVVTYILNLSASLARQQEAMLRQPADVPHFELRGKTLGIIGGTGKIAQRLIPIAMMLGMKVIAYNRTPIIRENLNVVFTTLDDVLERSDFLTLHCPLNKQTKHLINRERLRKMKRTAYIINTARGSVINEYDLVEALLAGEIAGAALDVLEQEPPEPANALLEMPNVILTPHIGWKRYESRQRLIDLTAANIAAEISGEAINIVNE
jgi:glycerate dehydrogenase